MDEEFKDGMVIDETMKADLLSSAKWAKFLLILGTIAMVIYFIMGIVVTIAPFVLPPTPMLGGGIIVGPIYVIVSLIAIYPLVKGFQFANGVKAACKTGSEAELARGFAGMHAYLRFSGILSIICLVVVVIALIAALVLGCSMGNCPAA